MFRCPGCQAPIDKLDGCESVVCTGCGLTFDRVEGFLSLLPRDSKWDNWSPEKSLVAHETAGTVARMNRYFAPLLRKIGVRTVLCIGCGDAADVTELAAAGYEAYGFDLPYRLTSWTSYARDNGRVFFADGRALPIADDSFDAAIALGVIEHVGAIGSSCNLEPDWEEQRIAFIRESTRLVKPGGSLIIAAPNGACPVDMQHKFSRTRFFRALGQRTGVCLHSPRDPFLPSYRRVRRWVAEVDPALDVEVMPLVDYLGLSFQLAPFLRPLAGLVRVYFRLLDRAPRWVRESGLNPYLIARIRVSG
jgi:SAM-dependent methyltransferase